MTPEKILKRIEEIEARAEKATPGPWIWEDYSAGWSIVYARVLRKGTGCQICDFATRDDAEFIVTCREFVPRICRVVRQLVTQNAAMRRALERVIEVGVGQTEASFSHMTSEDCALCEEKDEIAEAALAENDAGRALLERLRRLEAVAEAARALVASHKTQGYRQSDEGSVPLVGEQELLNLEQALATLEEDKKHNDDDQPVFDLGEKSSPPPHLYERPQEC